MAYPRRRELDGLLARAAAWQVAETAKARAFEVPATLLARADEVIE